jgi:hypothetical protein
MATVFLRPDHLHDPALISSSSSESGLTTQPATPGSDNLGVLRLKVAGEPTAAVDRTVLLQSGGNPTGYSSSGQQGAGVAMVHRLTSDATTKYKGYVDTPFLTRVQSPVSAYSSSERSFSVPRTLSNGDMGFILSGSGVGEFVVVQADGTVTQNTMASGRITGGANRMLSFAILENGRLIALVGETTLVSPGADIDGRLASYYSDDNGANWTLYNQFALVPGIGSSRQDTNLEVVGDTLVAVVDYSSGGTTAPTVWTSYDGGFSFSQTGAHTSAGLGSRMRTCVTKTGRVLVARQGTNNVEVQEVIPGGGFGEAVQANVGDYNDVQAIACRDDGAIFVWGFNASGSGVGDAEISVSVDDGVTFTKLAEGNVFDLHDTPTANPFAMVVAGSWREKLILLMKTEADTGSDYNILMLTWGEYANVSEAIVSTTLGQPYSHTYIPVDVPNALGWTKTDAGGGATIANQQSLNIAATSVANSYYSAASAFFNPSAGDTVRLRFRCRVNSGGDADENRAYLRLGVTDATNQQLAILRFSTTEFKLTDGPGNALGTVTLDMTNWTDILIAYTHDDVADTSAELSLWTKQDADDLWVEQITAATITEDAGTANILRFGGGISSGAVDWDIMLLETADDDGGKTAGFTNPDDLVGRPLSASVPMWLDSALLLGGINGGGMPGDTYVVTTAYEYDKRNIWRELRPSRFTKSTSDGSALNIVFDAGANNVFTAKHVAMFGTNARTITFEMNATDSWGAPSVSQAMTTQIATGTTSTGNRGPGYIGPSSGTWIPGQFRSDGDAHRYFITVADDTYEITDNDQQTIYVEGVDFSAQGAATFYIFSDRAGAVMGSTERYRFMRVSIAAQDTSDEYLKLSTLIVGEGFTPDIDYSHNFTDRVAPNVTVQETEAGYKSSARVGPRKYNVSIQWDPINRMHADYGTTGEQIEAFYAAIEGENKPIAFWRDTDDIDTLRLVRVEGTLSRPNQRGELATGLARVDTLILSEEL